jgi:RNA polymerase sigma-70 factor (ECF subfamily)
MQIRQAARDAFLRYRDHHDVAALATVFDLVSQELILVASHLASRGDSAEDLVQETFVTAIHHAQAFDATRPLEPWLLGILANLARNARRKAARSAQVAGDLHGLLAEPEPADTVAAREFVEALHANLRRLPPHLREVLTLHLVHHMTPTEIAHAKGRPVGTIKSQVHRGLRELRRLLPASFAAGLSTLVRASRPLASLREHVLAAADALRAPLDHTAATTAARTTQTRWLHLSRGVVLATTIATVALVAGVFWAATANAPVSIPDRTVGAAGSATTAGRAGENDTTAVRAGERVAFSPAAASLRIHTHHDRRAVPAHGFLEPRRQPDPFLRRRWFATDDDGLAVVDGLAPGPWLLTTDRGQTVALDLQPGQRQLDVALPSGVHLDGIVVTAAGAPVAGADVWLSCSIRIGDGFVVTTTDGDGRFALDHAPRGHFLSAFAPRWRAATLLAVPEATPAQPLRLVLDEPAGTATLSVTDAAGAPLVGATVQVGQQPALVVPGADGTCAARPAWLARTDENGTVTCAHVAIDRHVWVGARAADLPATETWFRLGDGGTGQQTLQLHAGASCDGTVELDGPAAGDITLVAHAPEVETERGFTAPPWVEARAHAAAGGSYRLTGIRNGSTLLRAVHGEHFAEHRCDIEPGAQLSWSPHLMAGASLTGTAATWLGAPLRGYTVLAEPPVGPVLVTTVDANGTFRLAGLGDTDYEVRLCDGAGFGANTIARRRNVRPGSELAFLLDAAAAPSAFVVGRIVSPDGEVDASVSLIGRTHTRDHTVTCQPDGTFRIGPVTPGPYHWFATTAGANWAHRPVELDAAQLFDLGVIDQQPPRTLECILPADVVPAPSHVWLWTQDGRALLSFAGFAAGRAELVAPPGPYALRLTGAGAFVSTQAVDLHHDRQQVVVDAIDPRAVEVRLEAFAPAPVRSLQALWSVTGTGQPWNFLSERRDRAEPGQPVAARLWLAPGAYRVECRTVYGSGEATFVLPLSPGATMPAIRLRDDR